MSRFLIVIKHNKICKMRLHRLNCKLYYIALFNTK